MANSASLSSTLTDVRVISRPPCLSVATSPRDVHKMPISAAAITTAWHACVQSEFRSQLTDLPFLSVIMGPNHSCAGRCRTTDENRCCQISSCLLQVPDLAAQAPPAPPAIGPRRRTETSRGADWLNELSINARCQQQADGEKVENKDDSLLTESIRTKKEISLSPRNIGPQVGFPPGRWSQDTDK